MLVLILNISIYKNIGYKGYMLYILVRYMLSNILSTYIYICICECTSINYIVIIYIYI